MSIITKAELRNKVLADVKAMTSENKAAQEKGVFLLFEQLIYSADVKKILLYSPIAGEFDISSVIQYCIKNSIDIYMPRVVGSNIEIAAMSDGMAIGAYGILEPIGQTVDIVPDMVIVPCVAMDSNGGRLGRGKGYYDRYLANYTGRTVALIYREQIVNRVPNEPHDIMIGSVIAHN